MSLATALRHWQDVLPEHRALVLRAIGDSAATIEKGAAEADAQPIADFAILADRQFALCEAFHAASAILQLATVFPIEADKPEAAK